MITSLSFLFLLVPPILLHYAAVGGTYRRKDKKEI